MLSHAAGLRRRGGQCAGSDILQLHRLDWRPTGGSGWNTAQFRCCQGPRSATFLPPGTPAPGLDHPALPAPGVEPGGKRICSRHRRPIHLGGPRRGAGWSRRRGRAQASGLGRCARGAGEPCRAAGLACSRTSGSNVSSSRLLCCTLHALPPLPESTLLLHQLGNPAGACRASSTHTYTSSMAVSPCGGSTCGGRRPESSS